MSKLTSIFRYSFSVNIWIFYSDVIITDPNADEENLASTQVTIAVCEGEICLMHKPGGSVLAPEQLELCLKQAINREKSIRSLMDSVLK